MSCAGYKFPATSPNEPNDGFALEGSTASQNHVSAKTHNADDYFAMKPPLSHSQKPTFLSPKKPVGRNQCSGSVSSLGSEATFTENLTFTSHDFNMSTDTLFEDCEDSCGASSTPSSIPVASSSLAPSIPPHSVKAPRNVLSLSLNMPKKSSHHKARSSIGTTTGGLARQAMVRDAEASGDAASLSAVEPRFQLDRKYSLGIAEETLGRERSGSPLTPVPTLKKQNTLPNLTPTSEGSFLDTIKTQQMKRLSFVAPQENFRDSILKLSPTISYLSPRDIVCVIRQSTVSPETRLRDVLVLDIRPLADHVKSHISGSINICLPSTLLKRASFDFKRCVNSLPAYEKVILQNYFYHNNLNFESKKECVGPHSGAYGFPAIILYDHSNTSSNIYHMCKKLIDHSCFDASSAPPIYLIDGPFSALAEVSHEVLGSGKVENIDIASLSISDPLDETKTSVAASSSSRAAPPRSLKITNPTLSGLSTPNVSNFSLPTNLPQTKFKIRHNEEMFDFSTAPSTEDKLSTLSVSSPGLEQLPVWLRSSVANNTQIRADFNKLEECEKSRLNSALKIKMENHFATPGGHVEVTPVINSGLDYGHKNRYKDIFLYEHSRVSLNDSSKGRSEGRSSSSVQSGCDYINASYLKSSESVFGSILGSDIMDKSLLNSSNCIATQGPLPRTAGDFWKCVALQGALVIISLTNDVENGVEKCFAFWKSGRYMSGDSVVDVTLVEMEEFGALKLRTFAISIDARLHHKVMQLHLDTWVDMGVAVDSDEVLAMIHLKDHILSSTSSLPEYPTVIHCSAGCGRTGVFAATDMLINAFKFNNNNFDVISDPVYGVVNDLRRQRISMVQTVRQYSSIYSLLIHRIIGQKSWQSISETNIAKSFWNNE